MAIKALEVLALSMQALGQAHWPQPTFTNDNFHALEPARHVRVICWEIEQLWLPIGECTITHVHAAVIVRPSFLWC